VAAAAGEQMATRLRGVLVGFPVTRPPRTFGTRRGRSDSSRATCAAGGK
jgi:hypothetical protein